MSSDSEEVEIKIEYNESFETDPLCDNFEMRMPVKFCVDNRTNFDQFDVSLLGNLFSHLSIIVS